MPTLEWLTIFGTGHAVLGVEPRGLSVDRARVMSPYSSCSIGGEMVDGAEASESDERSSRAAIRQMECTHMGFMTLSQEELSSKQLAPETLEQAANQVKLNGFVVLENAVPVDLVDDLNQDLLNVIDRLMKTDVITSEYHGEYVVDIRPQRVGKGGVRSLRAGLRLLRTFNVVLMGP